jgi:hypothetical protein
MTIQHNGFEKAISYLAKQLRKIHPNQVYLLHKAYYTYLGWSIVASAKNNAMEDVMEDPLFLVKFEELSDYTANLEASEIDTHNVFQALEVADYDISKIDNISMAYPTRLINRYDYWSLVYQGKTTDPKSLSIQIDVTIDGTIDSRTVKYFTPNSNNTSL